MRRTLLFVALLSLYATGKAQTGNTLTTEDAKNHIGQIESVCGKVVSTRYAAQSKGQPTFLNFDQPYPHEIFTVVIWGNSRSKFGEPESKYRDASVCVSGKITSYHGIPEIIASDPGQIATAQTASSRSDASPQGATAQCRDGTYSFSQNRRGTCSHHGGVSRWL